MKKFNIWLIGADGLLGSTICRLMHKKKINFESSCINQVDICKKAQVDEFCKNKEFTHIINCSAYTQVDLAEKEMNKAFAVNKEAPAYLAKIARENGAKFIHFSTDYVFDGKKTSPYFEEDMPNPINVYGESKFEGEKAIFKQYPFSCVIRTSWLFGHGGDNFVAKMLSLMQNKEKLSVVDDQIGRFTFAQDLAEATMHLLDKQGLFHFANQEKATWYDMVLYLYQKMIGKGEKLICKSINPLKSEDFITIAKRPFYSILNTSKYEKVTQMKARTWRKAVDAYLEEAEK